MKNKKRQRFSKEFGKKLFKIISEKTDSFKKQEHAQWLGISNTKYSHFINGTNKVLFRDLEMLERKQIATMPELINGLIDY